MKTILLSFTWAFVTILIPLQIPVFQMSNAAVFLFINRFLFMLMLCIIFDKRDAAVDKIRGLHSLATAIKPGLLHYFMVLILLCYIWATLKMTSFQLDAWQGLTGIPYGETVSYGEQARRLGKPDAVRAVGAANGRNPLPIVLPCHRVIGADGSLTGFGGGLHVKQALLDHEAGLQPLF